MSFAISVNEQLGIVRISHAGEMDLSEMLDARREAGQLLQKHGFLRILVNVLAVDEMPDTLNSFEISSSHHQDLSQRVRLAVVTHSDHLPDFKFSENVASNRGFLMRGFDNEPEAIDWLLE